MTEQKPERIWAFPSVAFGWISGSWKHVGNTDGTEYILASTVATLIAQARAEGRREGLTSDLWTRWKMGENPDKLAKEQGVTRERMRQKLRKLDEGRTLVEMRDEIDRLRALIDKDKT